MQKLKTQTNTDESGMHKFIEVKKISQYLMENT